MRYIPDKKSAFGRYLSQSPKAKIIKLAIDKKKSSQLSLDKAKEIFKNITEGIKAKTTDLNLLKTKQLMA